LRTAARTAHGERFMTHAVANTRALAAEIVDRWLRTHAFPDRLLESVSADRAFVMEVVYGVVKRRRSLEWVVHRCARRTPDPGVMATLMVGLYQILCMDHVAPYAAVNETVEAIKIETARKSGVAHRGIVGFVNGVLRAALRDRESLMHDIESESLGIRESHPDELVRRWTEGFGDRRALKLCQWNNGRPEVCLRLNRRKTTVPAFVKLLAERSVSAKPHPFAPTECLVLCHAPRTADSAAPEHTDHDATAPRRIADLPGYANGLFNIQDPSTLTAVKLLNPQPGELVLDACASPGGKTVIIAER